MNKQYSSIPKFNQILKFHNPLRLWFAVKKWILKKPCKYRNTRDISNICSILQGEKYKEKKLNNLYVQPYLISFFSPSKVYWPERFSSFSPRKIYRLSQRRPKFSAILRCSSGQKLHWRYLRRPVGRLAKISDRMRKHNVQLWFLSIQARSITRNVINFLPMLTFQQKIILLSIYQSNACINILSNVDYQQC